MFFRRKSYSYCLDNIYFECTRGKKCVFLLVEPTGHNSFRKGGACGKLKATPPAVPPESPAPIAQLQVDELKLNACETPSKFNYQQWHHAYAMLSGNGRVRTGN